MTHPGLKHPGRWLWLLLLIPVAVGLARLRFDVEIFDLLPNNVPAVEGLKLYQQRFANARELIVTLQAASPEQAESAARIVAENVRGETNLVASVTWAPLWIEHPGQAAELIAYLWFNQPPTVFQELTNRFAQPQLPALLAAAREELATSLSPQEIARLSYDPFGLTRLPESVASAAPSFQQGQEPFSSADGKFRMIFIQANRDLRTYRDCDEWLTAIKPIIGDSFRAAGGNPVELGFTGRPAFVAETALGMQHDISLSVGGTAGIIALLFWLAHRRMKPMLWLLTLLAIILACTVALGGLIFGAINVVSLGFAAILLGLAVDYAVVHYQEALAHLNWSIPQIRHAIAPSIFWAAVTTISAFLVLNFGGLPGLAQLGTLVAVGVTLAAFIMIFEFLPPLFPERRESGQPALENPEHVSSGNSLKAQSSRWVFGITGVVLAGTFIVLVFGLPRIDNTANALRPRHSPAYAALEQIQQHVNQEREPLWLIVGGSTQNEVAERLAQIQPVLERAVTNRLIDGFTLPTALWPHPAWQAANRPVAEALASQRSTFRQAARAGGFAESSLALTEGILTTWERAAQSAIPFLPTNSLSRWLLDKFAAGEENHYFALGLITPLNNKPAQAASLHALEAELPAGWTWLSGWVLLGDSIFARVKANMWKVLVPMICLVLLSLWLAFRRPIEILLSLAVLLMSTLCLLAAMRLAGWNWNLLDLMGIPLILGTGVDYSIFMQLALRRYRGDLSMAYRSVGRALLLCGGTAVAGFGSLGFSTNAGMGSLGQVCAVGIASNMLIAIFLLPVWWYAARRSQDKQPNTNSAPTD